MPSLAETAGLAELSVCEWVAAVLPDLAGSRALPPTALAEHVETCLSCQAELARYHRLLRMLSQLAADRVELPPGALGDLLTAIGAAARRGAIRSALAGRRVAYGAGLLAGCLAVTGAVALGRLHGSGRRRGSERLRGSERVAGT